MLSYIFFLNVVLNVSATIDTEFIQVTLNLIAITRALVTLEKCVEHHGTIQSIKHNPIFKFDT